MSIADRIEDARLLALQGRNEGALLNVLLAVAAASAAVYPESAKTAWRSLCRPGESSDGCRFRMYLAPRLVHLLTGTPGAAESALSIEFRGKQLDLETLLYKHYRCTLAHEGELPSDVKWDPSDAASLEVSFGGGDVLSLGGAWLRLLALAAQDRMPQETAPQPRRYRILNRSMWDMVEEDIRTHHLVPSGVRALKDALLRVDAPTPADASSEELQRSFSQLVACGWINEAALSFMRDAAAIEGHDQLTGEAFGLLQKMAALVEFVPATTE